MSKLKYLYRWDQLVLAIRRKYLQYLRLKYSNSVQYWNNIKNKHKGKAGFVIGNGPSLRIDDLTKIKEKGFISIASNKIYLAFDKTSWRPDFYTVADPILWDKIKNEIHNDIKTVHIPNYLDGENSNKQVIYWNALKNDYNTSDLSNISNDLSIGAVGGNTITYENIQIALHLGLNPIYLIGCDHYYPGEKNVKAGDIIKQSDKKTHFIEGYRKPGELVYAAGIDKMTEAYKIARLYADIHNIKIYNATRGGHLEIFERIDLDEILK